MLSHDVRRWIEDATGGRVTGVAVMRGATSSALHSVEVESDGQRRAFVLRRFTDSEWVRREPEVAVREAVSVQHARRAGLPAPELVATDKDGSYCGVPATLVTLLAGDVVLQPPDWKEWIDGLARGRGADPSR